MSSSEQDDISSKMILISFAIIMFASVLMYNEFCVSYDIPVNLNFGASQNNVGANTVGKINLNTASKDELIKIKGVGEVIAGNIIEYRESHGGFSNIDEILNVRGIGNKYFQEIKNIIYV